MDPPILYRFEAVGPARASASIGEPTTELQPVNSIRAVTDRAGRFSGGPNVAQGSTIGAITSGTIGFKFDGTKLIYEVRGSAVDVETGEMLAAWAPPGANIASPLNNLLRAAGGEARARSAIRLPAEYLNLRADVPLGSVSGSLLLNGQTSADITDGSRIAAANIRVLALLAAIHHTERPISDVFPGLSGTDLAMSRLGSWLAANPDIAMFGGGFEQWLRASDRYPVLRDDVVKAADSLLTRYVEAASRHNYTGARRVQYLIGIRIWLAPRLVLLTQNNDAATAARFLAVTMADVEAETAAIAAMPPEVAPNTNFYAGSDVVLLGRDAERIVPQNTSLIPTAATRTNDVLLTDTGPGLISPEATIQSVSVPASAQGKIRAALNADQSITVGAQPGFVGTTYYEYRTRAVSGERATGRGYVVLL